MLHCNPFAGANGATQVKPICVALMGIAAQTPTPYSEHHKLIDKLYAAISTVPSSTMDLERRERG